MFIYFCTPPREQPNRKYPGLRIFPWCLPRTISMDDKHGVVLELLVPNLPLAALTKNGSLVVLCAMDTEAAEAGSAELHRSRRPLLHGIVVRGSENNKESKSDKDRGGASSSFTASSSFQPHPRHPAKEPRPQCTKKTASLSVRLFMDRLLVSRDLLNYRYFMV